MSNRSGRSWYRLSSIVRPTAYSSRDPSSPRHVIEPPLSPTASHSPSPPPRSPPKEVREAKPSPVLSPRPSIKHEAPKGRHERETISQKILTYSDNTNLVLGPNKDQQKQHDDELSPAAPPLPPTQPRSPPNEVRETKPSSVISSRSIKYEPPKQQQQQTSGMDQTGSKNNNNTMMSPAAQPSHPPPQLMSPPLRPPLPEEVQEAEPTPVTSLRSINHETPKPTQEHETSHQKNILTLSEKTGVVHGPNETLIPESDGDLIMGTKTVITITGENKGAVMMIVRSPRKTREPYLSVNDAAISTQVKSKSKPKNHSDNDGENCFVNSNVQIMNGSVVYNSLETHHDPGIHLSLYRKPSSSKGYIIKDHGNGYTSSIN